MMKENMIAVYLSFISVIFFLFALLLLTAH